MLAGDGSVEVRPVEIAMLEPLGRGPAGARH
jgi:hypothetical protein